MIRHFPGDGGRQHLANFLTAVRAGRPDLVNAPVREGALSSGLCHLANLAHRVGSARAPDRIRNKLPGRGEAGEMLDRILRHLEANEVDLARHPLTVGGWLEWDHRDYQFVGGPGFEQANQLIGRDYRAPFVVPAKF